MQVYAAAIVYNACRIAQSEAAEQLGLPPEEISPAKLFPQIAVARFLYLHAQEWERQWRRRHARAHPHLVVRWRAHRWTRTAGTTVRVEHRDDVRRRRRFCAARHRWKSLRRVRGGQRFLAKLS